MTDERGGRYSREARFFLAGDKVAAQSHILEARSLMGYMRDMQALGGPPIQAKHATLQDGTQIKAVMMNGQYQAEIVSPFGSVAKDKVFIPTVAGHEDIRVGISLVGTNPFKWQKSTGKVYLGKLTGYTHYYVQKVSDAGDVCVGYATGPGVTAWVAWDSEGAPTNLGAYGSAAIDVRYGDPTFFPMPLSFQESGDYQTQRISGNEMLFLGGVLDPSDNMYYATATKVTLAPAGEQVLITGPLSPDGFSSSSQDASVMFYTLFYQYVHPVDGGIHTLHKVRKAVRNSLTGAYDYDVDEVLHPALEATSYRPFCDASGDMVVAGELEQYTYSWLSYSVVPAAYTQSTGELVRLEPHTGPTGTVNRTVIAPRAVCSDGSLVAGIWFFNTSGYAIAWQKIGAVWTRIPGIDASFRGDCTAAN